ncbi:cytochrome P450, partial [Biscogniauxia mediterranea]
MPWVMHRRKDIYGDDADEFRPERWESLRLTFEYLPFNAGPRICIGQQFALTQLAMVTFRLLQAFPTIEPRDDRPPIQRLGVNTSMLYGTWVSM